MRNRGEHLPYIRITFSDVIVNIKKRYLQKGERYGDGKYSIRCFNYINEYRNYCLHFKRVVEEMSVGENIRKIRTEKGIKQGETPRI